jgi:23S rRNA pseudouridine1911/1915/1917 synthase
MIDVRSYKVAPPAAGQRLDLYLSRSAPGLNLSRSQLQKLIADGRVKVNGASATAHQALKAGDLVSLVVPEPRTLELGAEDIPLSILFEDKDLIVVNKQAGLVTHPAPGNQDGTLVNALLHHCRLDLPDMHGARRPGIVHRLDKDTSGCLVVAKTEKAFKSLTRQIQDRSAKRNYWALAWGRIPEEEATIDAPIGRSRQDRKRMAVVQEGGREAVTHFKVMERFSRACLLEVSLETGRTHQIRVHLASIQHPVVGDPEYGAVPSALGPAEASFVRHKVSRQMLHAVRLEFSHPASGKRMVFQAPLPRDMQEALDFFRKGS